MKYKTTTLLTLTDEEGTLLVRVNVSGGEVISFVTPFTDKKITMGRRQREITKFREHNSIRCSDRSWCYQNIPSTILWKTEAHHDWNNSGGMYLLDPEEHRRITRKERGQK